MIAEFKHSSAATLILSIGNLKAHRFHVEILKCELKSKKFKALRILDRFHSSVLFISLLEILVRDWVEEKL